MARILVVDDEPDIAENIAALLRAKGHVAAVCLDGALALDLARKSRPDLVLLDVMLPRMSGVDVCRFLREDPGLKGLKIVMVTGLGRGGDVETAFAAGADDYLIKPFDSQRLYRKLEKVLAAS